ncbi:hypothetical protein U5801_17125, partial [Lamprobacter modestohalophilus]|nr:hypothetical protein [Lamprobacter modestohalophilus]
RVSRQGHVVDDQVRAKAGALTEHSRCSALFRLEASRGADEAQPFVNRELPQRRKVSSGRTSLLSRLDGPLIGIKAALGLPADQAVLEDAHIVPAQQAQGEAGLSRERAGVAVDDHRLVAGDLVALRHHLAQPLCLRPVLIAFSRRWESRGILRTMVLMWRLRLAYALGADPARLARLYR